MKNRSYYILFLLYFLVVAFILYINGVFAGSDTSIVNLAINLGFLVVIGVLFVIAALGFGRLNRCTDELVEVTEQMQKEYREANGRNLWGSYQERRDVFQTEVLKNAFDKYRMRMKGYQTRRGYVSTCELEEYINEDLLDKVGMNYFNSGISGALTGLGILGTFLGLSMGLGSFSGNDIYTISDNVGPLLSGMKVAFHTSVYGIFFSLVFNLVYRSIMADAYGKLENFLKAFKQFATPVAVSEDENTAAMVIYQANIANSLKQIQELLKGSAVEQTAGVERIVDKFMEQMAENLGVRFQEFGSTLKSTGRAQAAYADNCKELMETAAALVEVNRNVQEMLQKVMERQEEFARDLKGQKEKLSMACDEMSAEISNQLYAFDQMRSLYEK